MTVRVDEARDDGHARRVDQPGTPVEELADVGSAADSHESAVLNGKCLGIGLGVIDSVDATVDKREVRPRIDCVGGIRRAAGHGQGAAANYGRGLGAESQKITTMVAGHLCPRS